MIQRILLMIGRRVFDNLDESIAVAEDGVKFMRKVASFKADGKIDEREQAILMADAEALVPQFEKLLRGIVKIKG